MSWKIGQAKQHLSTVVQQAAQAPQIITNRDRVVAAVVGAEEFQEFLLWKRDQARDSMAEPLAEAQRICTEEQFSLVVPPRADRENPMLGRSHAPARHKRHQ